MYPSFNYLLTGQAADSLGAPHQETFAQDQHNFTRSSAIFNHIIDNPPQQGVSIIDGPLKGSLILNDALLMLDAALDGAGIVYTTEAAIRDKVRSGKLEVVLDQFTCTSTGFYLYFPKRSQVLPKLRVFIEHIKSENKLPAR